VLGAGGVDGADVGALFLLALGSGGVDGAEDVNFLLSASSGGVDGSDVEDDEDAFLFANGSGGGVDGREEAEEEAVIVAVPCFCCCCCCCCCFDTLFCWDCTKEEAEAEAQVAAARLLISSCSEKDSGGASSSGAASPSCTAASASVGAGAGGASDSAAACVSPLQSLFSSRPALVADGKGSTKGDPGNLPVSVSAAAATSRSSDTGGVSCCLAAVTFSEVGAAAALLAFCAGDGVEAFGFLKSGVEAAEELDSLLPADTSFPCPGPEAETFVDLDPAASVPRSEARSDLLLTSGV